MSQPLTIIGAEGSPYSRKLRAALRYRHIPHRWVVRQGPEYRKPPPIPVDLVPVLVWHDADGNMVESMVDSTPQLARLEDEYPERSLRPPDAALGFLDALVEDWADEWGTKFMFHYRWRRPRDIDWAKGHLIRQINPGAPAAVQQQLAEQFAQRQINRLWVVGSTDATAPVIEAGYARLLRIMADLVGQQLFLFGNRPTAADFALHGQLVQLTRWDPTPREIAERDAPTVVAWCERMEDLSGWQVDDDQWLDREAVARRLAPLLAEINANYLPFLAATLAAVEAGADSLSCQIDGQPWTQKPMPYQAKCLRWLREHFARLDSADQQWLRSTAGLDPNGILTP